MNKIAYLVRVNRKFVNLICLIISPFFLQCTGDHAKDATGSKVEEIIVVCKTHFDIGYTHRVNELLDYYRTEMIDKALDNLDQSKGEPPEQQFTWTGPGWVMAKVTEDWDGQTPERRQRLDQAFRSGRFVTHAMPFTYETDVAYATENRRVQYACDDFARILKSNKLITRSMSRKGNCWINAVAESFFKSIKVEWIYSNSYENQSQASLSIFEWIESWYNRRRRYSALGYKTIEEFEKINSNFKHAA